MSTKISKKVWFKKDAEKYIFSAHLGAANVMKNKLKIHQKTLTQACQILPKKAFFDTFSDPRLSKILKILSEKNSIIWHFFMLQT